MFDADTQKVLKALNMRPGEPLTTKQIDALCKFDTEGDSTFQRVRVCVDKLVRGGLAIGSAPDGIFLITNETMMNKVVAKLLARAEKIRAKARKIQDNFYSINRVAVKGKDAQNACYTCAHRRQLIGDAHSGCVAISGKDVFNITANPHGINKGWFDWPFNFDPVWLEYCDGYKRKD